MAYDPELSARLATHVAGRRGMDEKKMFGGIGWLLHGNMCVGVYKEWLVIRVGIEAAEQLLQEDHVKEMDITGRAMRGWAMVSPDGWNDDNELKRYVDAAFDFVRTLPPK